jgi:hypothetical protein
VIAGDIIDEARNKHPAFNLRDHPDRALRMELGRLEHSLIQRGIQRNPDYLATIQTVALPLAIFANGVTLDPNTAVHYAAIFSANGVEREVDIVPWAQRNDPRRLFTATVLNGVLFLLGSELDWQGWTSLNITITPMPTAPAVNSDPLTIDDLGADTLTAGLALFMAKRGPRDPQLPVPSIAEFRKDYDAAVSDFEISVGNLRAGQVFRTREVWQ